MSKLIVEMCKIDKITRHPNADNLEIATIKGWQVVVGKGLYSEGAHVVYVPPDSVLPEPLADRLQVAKYLSKGRVKSVKLRGEYSFGLAFNPLMALGHSYPMGHDCAAELGITKWQPPVKILQGDQAPDDPDFHRYTDIENINNFPDVMNGLHVVIAEKIHGTNTRVGFVNGQWMAGSHNTRRKPSESGDFGLYGFALSLPHVKKAIEWLANKEGKNVIMYGEVFGKGVQDMEYGLSGLDYAMFDIMVGGRYMDWSAKLHVANEFDIQMPHVIASGSHMTLAEIKSCSIGPSGIGGTMREGVVVTPSVEVPYNEKLGGRLILKSINPEYLTRKNGTEGH